MIFYKFMIFYDSSAFGICIVLYDSWFLIFDYFWSYTIHDLFSKKIFPIVVIYGFILYVYHKIK